MIEYDISFELASAHQALKNKNTIVKLPLWKDFLKEINLSSYLAKKWLDYFDNDVEYIWTNNWDYNTYLDSIAFLNKALYKDHGFIIIQSLLKNSIEKIKKPSLYLIQAGDSNGPVKLGFSNNIKHRLYQLQVGHYEILTLIDSFEIGFASKLEHRLQKIFKNYHIRGEWFDSTIIPHCQKFFRDAGNNR